MSGVFHLNATFVATFQRPPGQGPRCEPVAGPLAVRLADQFNLHSCIHLADAFIQSVLH